MISKFERVARAVEVTPGQLRDAMDKVGRERGQYYVTISVRGAESRLEFARPGTVLWDVAKVLRIEPEDLKYAIGLIYDPSPHKVAALTHRVRLTPAQRSELEREKATYRRRNR